MSICALQLDFESDSRAIFKSSQADFTKFEEVSERYPGLVTQVLLLIEGEKLFTPKGLEAIRLLHLDLELATGVENVVSMFSARHSPANAADDGIPVFPSIIDGKTDLQVLHGEIQNHAVIKDKLLSADSRAALLVVTLNRDLTDANRANPVLAEIRETTTQSLQGASLRYALTGSPVIRAEVINSLRRDQVIFIAAGILVGILISALFFRKLKFVIITNLPLAFIISTLLGGVWLFGQKLNVLTSMVTPLVTIIGLSNAMHLTFSFRRSLTTGKSPHSAMAQALKNTGPGCVLSTLTTALALLTLTITPYPFIYGFGFVAVGGALLALIGILVALPATAMCVLYVWPWNPDEDSVDSSLWTLTDRLCARAANIVSLQPGRTAIIGTLVMVMLAWFYLQNEPHNNPRENLLKHSETSLSIDRIDQKLSGSSQLRLHLAWPETIQFPSARVFDALDDADSILRATPWLRTTWSLADVYRWASARGLSTADALKVIERNKASFYGKVLTKTPNTAIITAYFPNSDASVLRPRIKALEAKFNEFHGRWPQIEATFTGVNRLEAITATDMIATLNTSLLLAISVIILLIGLALRSKRAGIVSIVPNLLPIAAGGAFLYAKGSGLQFTSVVAFTIGFGMAVDSTIHYLNRYRIERNTGLDAHAAVEQALVSVGPALVISTLIFAAGLSATLFSHLPMVQLYGQVSILVLTVALAGDLLVLPAILSIIDRPRDDER